MPARKEFTPLFIRKMLISGKIPNLYRIYTSNVQYAEITAETAYEALKISGLKKALKIVYQGACTATILDKSDLERDETQEVPKEEKAEEPQA